jgi:hypothetical protein
MKVVMPKIIKKSTKIKGLPLPLLFTIMLTIVLTQNGLTFLPYLRRLFITILSVVIEILLFMKKKNQPYYVHLLNLFRYFGTKKIYRV